MQRVAALVENGDCLQALLRLWILAQEREGETSRLNRWERERASNQDFRRQIEAFRASLETDGEIIAASAITAAPLAFLRALDAFASDSLEETPPSSPIEEDGRRCWVVRTSTPLRSRLDHQTGCIGAQLTHHRIIPEQTAYGIRVAVLSASGRMAAALSSLAQAGDELRVWIGHVRDGARLTWETSPAGRFRLTGISPAESRHDSLRATLTRASESGAHAVILPEFTVDLGARHIVAEWLDSNRGHPFLFVVAGSFHEGTQDGWFNTAELWDHSAATVLAHRKLRLFGEADGLAEDVGEGNHVSVLVTPIGTLTLLICKDFMDEHPRVASLLREVPVDWALVPSYGDDHTSAAHRTRADSLARVGPGTTSILATQRNVEVGEGKALPGFAVRAGDGKMLDVSPDGGLVVLGLPTRNGALKRIK